MSRSMGSPGSGPVLVVHRPVGELRMRREVGPGSHRVVTPVWEDDPNDGAPSMRIIHTSDWHIGRTFEQESLEGFPRTFLAWLADRVEDHGVDLGVIAGDGYDRSVPSVEAVAVLDDGIDALLAAGAQVALISGNHDSARRLGFGARRQALGGVHVFTDDVLDPAPVAMECGGDQVGLVPVPFLDPHLVAPPRPGPDGGPRPRTHETVLGDALEAGRRALIEYPGVPSIAVAHAFVRGAATSDSEKKLTV